MKPVIAIGAVRTGAGKSQTSRRINEKLLAEGLKVVVVRHPMPYGDLLAQRSMRFATLADLEKHECTIEEMEEFEPHVVRGNVIYCGVDYQMILAQAENDPGGCDVIVWEGGNNDFSFYKPDLMVTLVDPLRPGHELTYWPGVVTLRVADVGRHQQDRQCPFPVDVATVRTEHRGRGIRMRPWSTRCVDTASTTHRSPRASASSVWRMDRPSRTAR